MTIAADPGVTKAINDSIGKIYPKVITEPATSISNTTSKVLGTISTVFNNSQVYKGVQVPIPNILSSYATYNYVITFSALSVDEINNPDKTYMTGKIKNVICKTANAVPGNRVKTIYGQLDFYIDNVVIDLAMGMHHFNNTNLGRVSFDVVEPYSFGLFVLACQQAAMESEMDGKGQSKEKNWCNSPFLLTIEFKGNTQTGVPSSIPNTTRYIPILLSSISTSIDATGCKHHIEATPWNHSALSNKHVTVKSDVAITGKTVQEFLQTGVKSLQAAINKRKIEDAEYYGYVEVPDQYLILFPTDCSSNQGPNQPKDNSATIDPTKPTKLSEVMKTLNVKYNSQTNMFYQDIDTCNEIGKSSMGFSIEKKGNAPHGDDAYVYDEKTKVMTRGKNSINFAEGSMFFEQDIDIPTIINEVVFRSKFAESALDHTLLTEEGFTNLWSIQPQVYIIDSSSEQLEKSGVPARLKVYNVRPYKCHSSANDPPNTKMKGVDALKLQAVKHYNYIFTGANTEVIDVKLNISSDYTRMRSADAGLRSESQVIANQKNASEKNNDSTNFKGKGNTPSKNELPTAESSAATKSSSDNKGGGGQESIATRAARTFYDNAFSGADLQNITFTIMGDPYWIAHSGMGNYVSQQTENINLNRDGTVNWQNGEVHVYFNFRTPIDINQNTGLYNFTSGVITAPIIHYDGLYRITTVRCEFKDGRFTQTLTGIRPPGQFIDKPRFDDQFYSLGNEVNKLLSKLF